MCVDVYIGFIAIKFILWLQKLHYAGAQSENQNIKLM